MVARLTAPLAAELRSARGATPRQDARPGQLLLTDGVADPHGRVRVRVRGRVWLWMRLWLGSTGRGGRTAGFIDTPTRGVERPLTVELAPAGQLDTSPSSRED